MSRSRSVLAPILRSETQANLLATVLLDPEQEHTLAEISRHTSTDPAALQREAERLVDADILADRRVGRARLLRPGTSQLVGPLTELLLAGYGPRPVITEALTGLPGVHEAYLYGSWAARYTGHPGHDPHDIDVLVIGTPDRNDLDDRMNDAAKRLRRDVQALVRTPQAWAENPADAFLTTLRSRPLLRLTLTPST